MVGTITLPEPRSEEEHHTTVSGYHYIKAGKVKV